MKGPTIPCPQCGSDGNEVDLVNEADSELKSGNTDEAKEKINEGSKLLVRVEKSLENDTKKNFVERKIH